MTLNERIEEFKIWVDYIPKNLYIFFQKNPNFKKSLNYSVESLCFLENYLIQKVSLKELKEEKDFHEGLAIYIGETFIKNMNNAYWNIKFEKKYIYSGIPIISTVEGFEDCPHYMTLTAIKRKKGNFLSTLFYNMRKYDGPASTTSAAG